jgi:hypothetical protein
MSALELSALAAPERRSQTVEAPTVAALAEATAGLWLLGASGAVGVASTELMPQVVPGVWAVAVATFALTGPSFLVAHQYLDHRSPPQEVANAVALGYAAMGVAAGGFSPFVLLFATTSGQWFSALSIAVALSGMIGLSRVRTALVQVDPELHALARAWVLLAGAVALRLAADVAWTLGGAA